MLCVDLGCGSNKPDNFIGVDIYPGEGVDIVADLSQTFPFPDSSVDQLRAHDIIEHLPNKLHTMNEIWRVCKSGALVDIRVPSTDGRGAFQDPTHISFWNINSFFYYCINFPSYINLNKNYGFKGQFKLLKINHEESENKVIHVKAYLAVIKNDDKRITRENWQEILSEIEPKFDLDAQTEELLQQLSANTEQYQQDPTNRAAIANLRQKRRQVSEQWLNLPENQLESAALGSLGKAYQLLLNSGIKNKPLTNSEQNFVNELERRISLGFDEPKYCQYLMTAMLYRRADQLPLSYDLPRLPKWLLNDYLKFMFYSPPYFQEVGESDSYYRYMHQWVDYLYTSILGNANSAFWQNIAVQFIQLSNFIPLYFNENNLKELYVKRAEIIEYVFKLNGHKIEYELADRTPRRKKVRLGILASHFTPAAETFASLPIYEYLSRDFEVILYSLSRTGHPLEQYCQSCANSFKVLPNNLTEQVNSIRDDELDFLFIATNITAGVSQIYLLSLHRLARIQITSVASVVTTGLKNVDYYVSGQLTDPSPEAEQHYQEQLLRLEGSAHCFSYGSEQNISTINVDRENLGISKESVVFVSVANMFKITAELSHTWAKIIASVPNSILLVFPFGPNWSSVYPKKNFLQNINKIFFDYGITSDKVIALDPLPIPSREDIKEYLKITNIYLDSYPFSGTTSLIEPLEIGLPLVSRQGRCFRSAMGAALLKELGVNDLVADSEESYIQLAVALGTNSELRHQKSQEIKEKMRGNPKFINSRAYSTQIGVVFQELFRKHQTDTLSNRLRLKDINLIIFPDWSQSEDQVYHDFARVLKVLATHPDKSQMTLLVYANNISEEDADLILSAVVMNLLMEEELHIEEGLEISLMGEMSELQWDALLNRLHAHIILENENIEAITQVKIETIPSCKIENVNQISAGQFFLLEQ